MAQNGPVSADRVHVGFFGLRNAGKSSVVNAVTGQSLSVVSDIKGTTTDPVQKAMELAPLGPVVIVDTPGIDDEGELGSLRAERARKALRRTDIAVLVVDALQGLEDGDRALIALFEERGIPYIAAYNKADLLPEIPADGLYISARTGAGIEALKERIARLAPAASGRRIVADLLNAGDLVVLVVPIDAAAPKGRLILPQQQVIREALEAGAICAVARDAELSQALPALGKKPRLVITDSQVFARVDRDTPADVELTSFSILFARYKGDLKEAVRGAARLDSLQDGDAVLISEGCTHHRQCEDIGTVKLPGWISAYTGKDIRFAFTSGGDFPDDLSEYALVVHCGGCMLNPREMQARARQARGRRIPITNYGIAIAQMHGILKRAIAPFGENL